MQIETADVSLIGHREENQDRVAVAAADQAVLLVVIDGMGGHAEGARAAETALSTLLEAFWQTPHPIFDPLGFLHLSLGRAHEEVVKLGAGLSAEARPRATCAVCLVQDSAAYWAHIGDSRVYQLRQAQVLERTRDHSHVEVLLREGLITEAEVHGHPMRNYVECCLGGDGRPKFRFGRAEFFRHPAAQFQESMIHGLKFPGEQSPGVLTLAPGKAGHATNHAGRR